LSIQKTPEANTIFFVWLNQYSGILLKTPSKTIAIDPVDVKSKDLLKLDAILITHEHYDHLDPPLITTVQKATQCTVIADAVSTKKLQHVTPNDKLQEAKAGSEIKIGAVNVRPKKVTTTPKPQ
jgi:L-ascorbate metabolism protein UlaG (beta-lactamase superfamily)